MQTGGLDQLQLPTPPSGDDAHVARLKRASEKGDAKDTAKQFETLFATMLVRELRRSMPEGIFGDGPGADVYEGWFDEHLGNALAQRDSLGLAGMIRTSIGHAQAAKDAAAAGEAGASDAQAPTPAPTLSGPLVPPFLRPEARK